MALNYVVENDVFEDGVDFDTEEETLRYFGGLLCRDDGERAQFVENFGRAVKSWMSKTDDIIAQRLLEVHLPTALRLSLNSPYKDVRTKMKKLLEEVQVRYKFCITLPAAIPVLFVCSWELTKGWKATQCLFRHNPSTWGSMLSVSGSKILKPCIHVL